MDTVRLDTVVKDSFPTTPTLFIDFAGIRDTFRRFQAAFPGAAIDYAMKANANPTILSTVVGLGGGIEIASEPELNRALTAGAAGDAIICSHPIKQPPFLRRMHEVGVYAVTVDSIEEVEKVARYAPGMRVYVRLAVDNTGSVLPLAGKFGVDVATALSLLDRARDLGLQPIGTSFHVGSQCLNVQNWVNAIKACGEVWRAAAMRGHHLYFLDIGGGFPAGHYHDAAIPTIEAIGEAVMDAVATHIPHTPDFLLALEPGRGLVGESGRLLTTVMGRALRGEQTWLYLDVGVFNGLMETFEGFPPVVDLVTDETLERPMRTYTLAGPSCDSCDVVARDILLPEIHIGDRLVFYDTGAYTNEYAAAFNGFPIPEIVMLNLGVSAFEQAVEELDLTPLTA
ncbi:MAG: type III PLP-dependent enzyme [Anaerolineae bacterium]|nr:type III PLP-dependent enzyme [Anaerolineae bacterium]NUQ05322.1 type III PLP-dependent enzyme [Anaerolineae bacterium]